MTLSRKLVGLAAVLTLAVGPAVTSHASDRHALTGAQLKSRLTTRLEQGATSSNDHRLIFGLSLSGVPSGAKASMAPLKNRAKLLHHAITLVSYFQSWSSPFDPNAATNVWDAGAVPMLAWSPYNPNHVAPVGSNRYDSHYDPNWTLAQINSGRYDSYIRATAQAMAALPFPIAIRLAHEQNGWWSPWGIDLQNPEGQLVNTGAQYRTMWRHVWEIFQQEKAKNVIFVWSPNTIGADAAAANFGGTWPGSKYVDWLGMSAYMVRSANWDQIGPSLTALHKVAPNKPMILAETAVGQTANKATGIKRLTNDLPHQPGLAGWVYFDLDAGRSDWRFETNSVATSRLRHALQSHRYYAKVPT